MERGNFVKNQRMAQIVSLLLVLLLLSGCSAPSQPATTEPETTESTFTATEPSESGQTATGGSATAPADDSGEEDPIALTKAALAENEWINLDSPDGYIGLPSNEAFLTALQFESWESVEDVTDSVEVCRFSVGNGEIIINEGSAYLLTDHGMDWYLIPEEVIGNIMMYMEENFTMSARSMLTNDEFLFTEYYYDSIASIGNLDEFDGHGPLNYEMVKYAWFRYCYTNTEETVNELYDEDKGRYIMPSEMAIREAKRYFDFDESVSDVTQVNFYEPEIDGFDFWYSGPENREGFYNSWSVEYGGTEEIGDNLYEVRLISYADYEAKRINDVNVMEISFDPEGNLKFERGYKEKPTYNLTDALPGFEAFDIHDDLIAMGGVLFGESESAYYFVTDDGEWVGYYRLDKETMVIEPANAPLLEDDEWPERVEQHGDLFYFYTTKRVQVTDADLNLMESVAYPEALAKAKMDRWEAGGHYFGETLSDDRSMFAYVDGDGLKLFTIATGQTELIKAKEGNGDETEAIWPMNPKFVNEDSMIITARTRDYNSGFYLYDLKSKQEKTVDGYIVWEPWQISDGRGFFVSDKVDAYFYDFKAGQLKQIPEEGRGPNVGMSEYVLCNGKYATYFDRGEDINDLVLLNLDTWAIEKRIPVENVDANILFLGENGDLGVRYFFTYENNGAAILRNK